MAIKAMHAFDHIPPTIALTVAYLAQFGASLPYYPYPVSSSTIGIANFSDGNWLQLYSVYSTGQNQSYLSSVNTALQAVSDYTQPKQYLGFRFKNTGSTNFTDVLRYIAANAPGTTVSLVTMTDFTFVLGKVYYIEVMIDRVHQTRTVWIDGNLVVNAAAISITAFGPADIIFFGSAAALGGNGSYVSIYNYKDIYYMDDPGDGTVTGRLGPLVAVPIVEAGATAGNWTPSPSNAGSVDTVLGTAITSAATQLTPLMQSPGDTTSITVPLTIPAAVAGQPIRGMTLLTTSGRTSGTSTQLKGSITDGTNTKALATQVYQSDALVGGVQVGLLTTALDGTPLTPAKIAQLTASFAATPVGA